MAYPPCPRDIPSRLTRGFAPASLLDRTWLSHHRINSPSQHPRRSFYISGYHRTFHEAGKRSRNSAFRSSSRHASIHKSPSLPMVVPSERLGDHLGNSSRSLEKRIRPPIKESPLQGQTAKSTHAWAQSRTTRDVHAPNVISQPEQWQTQKKALATKFAIGWQPRKKLSPDALDGLRALHAKDPETYDTPALADEFKISPEAVRRILKSRWRPSDEEQDRRKIRWEKRGQQIWSDMAEKGIKPPKRWRGLEQKPSISWESDAKVPGAGGRSGVSDSDDKNNYIPLADRI